MTQNPKSVNQSKNRRAPPQRGERSPAFSRQGESLSGMLTNWLTYQIDAWERAILFWDTLRQRGSNMLEHERQGLPPVLTFEHEQVLDARRFERPVNYALLRIVRIDGKHWDNHVDNSKAPVVVIDPRAGHGPGIGGFKRDSEVGMAIREGHPVYFVIFFPEPCQGQTLKDVHHALCRFVEVVAERHAGRKPILYGNCQAGWAAALVAADLPQVPGAAVLNGSPLSYWEGEPGSSPMRLYGGLSGGVWLTHLLGDLGDGVFDGAWLAANFEQLKPGRTLWGKHASLFSNVDEERERFLEFERWWNGFHNLSREEIVSIVQKLFIGDQLEQGKLNIHDDKDANLRAIRTPLVIFASYGDSITPPHQALGWVPAVYRDTNDLKRAGQRIVYLLNPHVGHLGIFVSAKVARLQHRAILEHLDDICDLEPGLYEMRIDNPTRSDDARRPDYAVHFHERDVSDLAFPYPQGAFERVRQVSDINERLYRDFLSPWVRLMASPWSAAWMRRLHPMRLKVSMASERINPWMHGTAIMARQVEDNRHPVGGDNPYKRQEDRVIESVTDAFEKGRELRDHALEQVFRGVYGSGP